MGKNFPWRIILIPIAGFDNYAVNERGQVVNTVKGNTLTPHLNENGYLYVTLRKDNKNRTMALHRLVALAYIPNPEDKPFVNHLDANRSNPHKENLEWCTQSENIKHAYVLGNMSQKKNFTVEETDWLLNEFISGNGNMTNLAKKMNVGLSRLTINMRQRAQQTDQVTEFENRLAIEKQKRNKEANASKQKPVAQCDLRGNELARFPSATAAARSLNKTSGGSIVNSLNPIFTQNTAYGYIWKYV